MSAVFVLMQEMDSNEWVAVGVVEFEETAKEWVAASEIADDRFYEEFVLGEVPAEPSEMASVKYAEAREMMGIEIYVP